ncbi:MULTISPECIES: GNAT family N-acetyltransferase [unclassified Fusibacter]|uniref:GNAT family N-acetyltransferase n=1 Tax=unclassified Fusibacter TaxID=2624464 RepID=UPI0010128A6C|nr:MULTISPECIES: GNAT family N-acetyltransferase [unclassified Fusibacter]MCK8061480.1 GNAT family N-acetyltransferase [Fusibacter sp. A2]NPE23665.1 GNAT family N-acetyltransferase [Fusibacter sp. A1]RXV58844.1 GNAT family N-acetyltransferase [Fusibacter sp. A1]
MDYIIRSVKVDDAQNILNYVQQVATESDNLTFGEGEFNMTLEEEEKFIEGLISSDNEVMFIAEKDDQIIGQIHYSGGKRNRTKHYGEFGITVKNECWGKGVGKSLIQEMIKWAEASRYCEKINLKVRDDNYKAITLYRKMGFKVEGLLKKDMKINGVFVDNLFMGLDIKKH